MASAPGSPRRFLGNKLPGRAGFVDNPVGLTIQFWLNLPLPSGIFFHGNRLKPERGGLLWLETPSILWFPTPPL